MRRKKRKKKRAPTAKVPLQTQAQPRRTTSGMKRVRLRRRLTPRQPTLIFACRCPTSKSRTSQSYSICRVCANIFVRFCGGNEENDPADEYEEYLACRMCGKTAHRQCARDDDAFKDERDGKNWLCQDCTSEEDEE